MKLIIQKLIKICIETSKDFCALLYVYISSVLCYNFIDMKCNLNFVTITNINGISKQITEQFKLLKKETGFSLK